ncbi:MAG: type II toxin-antitoxin system death-on-curing family toxin [Anaerolineales bacterium]|nr:type II toxin-antitoxin system death-on-curing family toxin [Anaerolineales bacterium]MCA9996479.1 type II toxin-antitoxin system death-on-curing family toxin [Anaerolineales bacterium]
MTVYLTPQQVLFIHARLIETTGGSHGLRDLGLLQSAVARPQATFDGADLYPDLWHKAAALMESLAQNYPFLDGNKRTAITATAMFLRQNGYVLQTTNEDLEMFVMRVVEKRPFLPIIAAWLQENARAV